MTTKDTPPDPVQDTPAPDPDTFNIDDWISGATRPEDVITLSSKGKEFGRFKALELELLKAQRAIDDNPDDRLVSVANAEPLRIATEMDALAKVIEKGRRPFRFRGLTEEPVPGDTQPDLKAIREQAKNLSDDEEKALLLSACCVDPQLLPEKWRALRGVLGEGQYVQAINTASRVTYGESVAAPFSVAASVALRTQEF